MPITATDIKKLREETGAGVMECKAVLTEAQGNYKQALVLIKQRGLLKAEKKSDRETKEGVVVAYVHANNKVASLVELQCETDFVARNDEFLTLAKNIAMQVAAMNPADVKELLAQEYIRDESHTVEQLVKQLSGKIGENMTVARFERMELGESQESAQ